MPAGLFQLVCLFGQMPFSLRPIIAGSLGMRAPRPTRRRKRSTLVDLGILRQTEEQVQMTEFNGAIDAVVTGTFDLPASLRQTLMYCVLQSLHRPAEKGNIRLCQVRA